MAASSSGLHSIPLENASLSSGPHPVECRACFLLSQVLITQYAM